MAKLVPAKMPSGDFLIYEYGIRLDKEAIEPAVNQILMARRLYNNIIAQIRETLDLMQADVLRRAGLPAQVLQERIDTLTDTISSARGGADDTRRRKAAAERSELIKQLSALLKNVRTSCRAEHQQQFFSRIGKKSTCATYQLRCQAVTEGLGWATANVVLDNALIAFKKSFSMGNSPRFAISEQKTKDSLTLQFTTAGGISAESLLGGESNDLSIKATNGCGPRKYGEFKFRLGRAADNQFATGTWQYHRPLPPDAFIGRARLVRKKIGKDYRWYLQLQVRTTDSIILKSEARKPLAAIHFGHAHDVNSRRVVGFADSGEPSAARVIQLPPQIEQILQRSTRLQSQRDRLRDALIPKIKADLTSDIELINDELAGICRLSPQYVSQVRLHRLCRTLSAHTPLPNWLEEWRKNDRQLWQAVAHGARRARNQRRDFYRKFALDVAKNYSTVVIEPLNRAASSQKIGDPTTELSAFLKKLNADRVVAALYELEFAVRWACTKTGAVLLELSDASAASTCAICGATELNQDVELSSLMHCSSCGAHFDCKQNGAALAYQIANPVREEAIEEFFIKAAEARHMQEQARATMNKRRGDRHVPMSTNNDQSKLLPS